MIKLGKSESKNDDSVKTKVVAFGFDQCGFEVDSYKKISNGFEYNFVKYDTHTDINQYDICIIPSGIFEELERRSNYMDSYVNCNFDKARLLEFERMILNFIRNKKTLIFLMTEIVKEISAGSYRTQNIEETDLAKKYLLSFFPRSESRNEVPHLNHNRNEFQKFTEKYGVGKTLILTGYNSELEFTPLISSGSSTFGVELLDKRLFFLPYHTTKYNFQSLHDLISSTVESATSYIQNHTVNVPDWVKDYNFTSEELCNKKIIELEKEIEEESNKLAKIEGYKSILCNQSDALAIEVTKILKSFFGLNIDDIDEKLDDFSILNDENNVICSGEIKGVAGNCKRKYLSQLNANRDMKEYPDGTKGLLVINDNLKIKTIPEKFETDIPNDCLVYSIKENINIIRTIDLINLMKLHEENSIEERLTLINSFITGEPGWIKCDGESFEIVKNK
ncbi:hypothetical protein OAT67_02335 [Bacteriovoracaceae bacterium]|nr:hypothetical protein [Bacteriovoracaceae bacterium]